MIYWIYDAPIRGRLAIMPCPRAEALAYEISSWRQQGVDTVVNLLELTEAAQLGLQREPKLCRKQAIAFVSFAIPDGGIPASMHKAAALVRSLASTIYDGKAVAIHCRAGIGRSSMIAAAVLVSAGGVAPPVAFDMISHARGLSVPETDVQRKWVEAFLPR